MKELLENTADAARWALLALFLLAAAEKASTLRHRTAAWHPIMLKNEARRRRAKTLMASSLIADAVAVFFLAASPRHGAVLAVALILAYSTVAVGVPQFGGEGSCQCFWRVMNTSSFRSFLARNTLLLGMTVQVGIVAPKASIAGIVLAAPLLMGIGLVTWAVDRISAPRRPDLRSSYSAAAQTPGAELSTIKRAEHSRPAAERSPLW